MFDDKGMLTDRARGILFWITLSMIALVGILAVVIILTKCSQLFSSITPPPVISPNEVTICAGEQRQFTVAGGTEVTWEATGGSVTQSGLFTAPDVPGDYTVTASEGGSRQVAEALVRVMLCTPTPTLPPPTPVPTPVPTAGAIEGPSADSQGDVGTYESGAPVAGVPPGVDIRAASPRPDLGVTLQPNEGIPAELAGWAGEGDVLLWISLFEPIPDPPVAGTQWLFVLDVDGNQSTGRPPGDRGARINPDLGDEVAMWVSYVGGSYQSGSIVWDAGQSTWVAGPDIRYYMDESRTLVAFALPLDSLTQAVAQYSGVAVVPEAVKGRAAAETYVGEQQRVIDFYPDVP